MCGYQSIINWLVDGMKVCEIRWMEDPLKLIEI